MNRTDDDDDDEEEEEEEEEEEVGAADFALNIGASFIGNAEVRTVGSKLSSTMTTSSTSSSRPRLRDREGMRGDDRFIR